MLIPPKPFESFAGPRFGQSLSGSSRSALSYICLCLPQISGKTSARQKLPSFSNVSRVCPQSKRGNRRTQRDLRRTPIRTKFVSLSANRRSPVSYIWLYWPQASGKSIANQKLASFLKGSQTSKSFCYTALRNPWLDRKHCKITDGLGRLPGGGDPQI